MKSGWRTLVSRPNFARWLSCRATTPETPRALVIYVPITTQDRQKLSYEVSLPKTRFLERGSVADIQGIGSLPKVRLGRRLGRFPRGYRGHDQSSRDESRPRRSSIGLRHSEPSSKVSGGDAFRERRYAIRGPDPQRADLTMSRGVTSRHVVSRPEPWEKRSSEFSPSVHRAGSCVRLPASRRSMRTQVSALSPGDPKRAITDNFRCQSRQLASARG